MSRQGATIFASRGGMRRCGSQAFFDKCLSICNRMAASSCMPPAEMKMAALSFSKAATLYLLSHDFSNAKPITRRNIPISYRLCVYASGSFFIFVLPFATAICNFFTSIKLSCLHFGQNSGKFSSTVSDRILIRVLLPQTGDSTQSILGKCFHPHIILSP